MTTYSASVRVDDGTLHVSRPMTAPEPVRDLIESLIYGVTESSGGQVLSAELTVESSGESETPIGDSITATSSTPLAAADDDEDDEPVAGGQA